LLDVALLDELGGIHLEVMRAFVKSGPVEEK